MRSGAWDGWGGASMKITVLVEGKTEQAFKPPAYHIKEVFAAGKSPRHYSKVRDAARILKDKDLDVAISRCAELKAFVNTIIRLSGGTEII